MPNTSILTEVNSTNYLNLLQVYQPAVGHSGFITSLGLTVNIKSIAATNFPYIPDNTPPDVLEQIFEKLEQEAQFKELRILLKKGAGLWIERARIRLFNKEPYYEVDLMPYFTKANTIDVAEDLMLGLQLVTGNTLAANTDSILVFGTAVEEKKNNGNEELAARIEALELALAGRLTNLPPNTLIGRNSSAGTAEFISQATFAKPADIDTAILNLIGGAPGALNTLDELAQALADDAGFASTITNLLALKAPLANPIFTGFVTLGDNAALKERIFRGTTDSAGNANFSHGLTSSKIAGIEILVGGFAPVYLAAPFGGSAEYNYFFTTTTFYIVAGQNKNSLLNVPYVVLIKYSP